MHTASPLSAACDLQVTQGWSTASDPATAIAEIWEQVHQASPVAVVLFCSSEYQLDALASAIQKTFPCQVFGCTTAGEIGSHGFHDHGISAVCLGGDVTADVFDIDLTDYVTRVGEISDTINRTLAEVYERYAFGLLLVDGLSRAEELLTANLYQGIGHIPLIGGSAGDDFNLEATHVLVDGRFVSGHAVFACITTMNRIMPVKFDHFRPSDELLIVTRSDPARRIIHELNEEPALEAYAHALGLEPSQVCERDFSLYPFIVEIGGHHYARSLQAIHPDGSLSLFCAVESGLVLSVADSVDPLEAAKSAFDQIRQHLGTIKVVLGCDCILRKREYVMKNIVREMGQLMMENRVVGFSTYGEQFNSVHINQTFTGIAIAA